MCDSGGHNDYGGNECYYYDPVAGHVVRANNPSSPVTQTCTAAYPDGLPSSRHNYGSQAYIPVSSFNPTGDRLFLFGGVHYCASGGFSTDTWTLALANVGTGGLGGWQQMDATLGNGGAHPSGANPDAQSQYDPNTGLVYVVDSGTGLWSYSLAANAYTFLSTCGSDESEHMGSVLDPVDKRLYIMGDSVAEYCNVTPGGGFGETHVTLPASCSSLPGGPLAGNVNGFAWDTVLGKVVSWPDFGPSIYVYDPVGNTCTTQTYTANAPPDSAHTGSPSTTNGTFGRFGYFPSLGLYVLVNDWNIDVHTLRITDPNSDFAARCASPGVLQCQGFDTASVLTGNTAAGVAITSCGTTCPTIDTTVYASGTGSLHFTVPAGATSANTSGSYNTNFTADLSRQIDSLVNGDPLSLTTACGGSPCGNTVYVQWRQRMDSAMLQHWANSNGFKSVIIGEGDQKIGATLYPVYSCSDIETDTQNSSQFDIAQMYYSCGEYLDEYYNLYTPTGTTDSHGNAIFSPENVAGGYLACTYAASINVPTVPPCFPYTPNNWMTFQIEISVGTWYPTGTTGVGGPPATFKHDSTIKMWAALDGQPSTLVIDYHPGATSPSCDAQQQPIPTCQTGFDLSNPTAYTSSNTTPCTTTSAAPGNCQADGYGNLIREKFGKVWMLPYQTNLNCPACTAANMWMDELIIGTQRIPDPKY